MEAWWIGLAASGTSGKMASSITVGRSCLLAKSAMMRHPDLYDYRVTSKSIVRKFAIFFKEAGIFKILLNWIRYPSSIVPNNSA